MILSRLVTKDESNYSSQSMWCELSPITDNALIELSLYSSDELMWKKWYLIQGKERKLDIVMYMLTKAYEATGFLKDYLEYYHHSIVRYFDKANRITFIEVYQHD